MMYWKKYTNQIKNKIKSNLSQAELKLIYQQYKNASPKPNLYLVTKIDNYFIALQNVILNVAKIHIVQKKKSIAFLNNMQ